MAFETDVADGQPSRRLVDAHVGSRIRFRRYDKGLEVPQLAAQAGLRPGQLAAVEAGEVRPSAAELYEIAQALETSIGAFYGDWRDDE